MAGLVLIPTLVAMLTIPGWTLLTLNQSWRYWQGLQRWIVAVGLSIAFYPILYYAACLLPTSLSLDLPSIITALLVIGALTILWRLHSHWKTSLAFDRLEWAAITVFGMTMLCRLWVIGLQPYPAWSDSLHHTLLTQLTAEAGRLPGSLEPYFPISLEQYHLGLYAISGTLSSLAQVPAHTALLWTAQVLNGLCGLGIYLVLDRKAGRIAAVTGAIVVGLLSHQPAFYVNWGRFTQLASQTIMPIGWLVTWETIAAWRKTPKVTSSNLWLAVVSAMLNAAVFLLHFRVAAFYIPPLIMSISYEVWQGIKQKQVRQVIVATGFIGLVALLLVAPALKEAAAQFIAQRTDPAPIQAPAAAAVTTRLYYEFPWNTIPVLAARPWLLGLAFVSSVIGLIRRNRLVLLCLGWTGTLILLGNTYRLGIPLLNLTNLGAILITLYLPIGLIVGAAAKESLSMLPAAGRKLAEPLLIVALLLLGIVGALRRAADIEPFRYFVTADDVNAMEWIKQNTPADALFAVNTFFWLPNAPHGTDAGYWIPYFTGRQTTAGVMLLSLNKAYQSQITALSQSVEDLETSAANLSTLYQQGVDYIYIGKRGDFSGPGLNADLINSPQAQLVYQSAGVSILEIVP